MSDQTPLVIAIDPGANGAIVAALPPFVTQSGVHTIPSYKIPETLGDLYEKLYEISSGRKGQVLSFLEHNTGYMSGIKNSDGESVGVSPKALYSFGRNTGHIEMALISLGIPVCRVTPIKWQNAAGVTTARKRLMTPTQWKNHLKSAAIERFPKTRVTLANADALLMLDAACRGRMKHVPNLF